MAQVSLDVSVIIFRYQQGSFEPLGCGMGYRKGQEEGPGCISATQLLHGPSVVPNNDNLVGTLAAH